MDGFYPLDGRFSYFELEEQQANVNFIHTFSFLRRLNAQLWNHIVLTGLEKNVIEALRIVEPNVENLAFVEEAITVDYEKQQMRVPYITLRGRSGRLIRLQIIGTRQTLTIGKELEIRRTLSPSHLYSSAFIVERKEVADGIPQRFVLRGAGWGHGVGLCQIGAAVMGEQGYDYRHILLHYFAGSTIEKLY